MARRLTVLALLLPVALLVLAACDRKAADGKPCRKTWDDPRCADPTMRLSCDGATWTAERCLGPKGCYESATSVGCDSSLADEGSRCGQHGDASCTLDRKSMLRCQTGRWVVSNRCLGPGGCQSTEESVKCDDTRGLEGDICVVDPAAKKVEYACSVDQKAVLTCRDGKWKKVESCTGPKGCSSAATIDCDGETASPGDFCVKEDGKPDYSCSPDRKARLRCEADGWKVESTCLGEKGCSSSGDDFDCDDSVQEPGAACDKEDEGSSVCSTDKKTMLTCKKGTFVKGRTCPKACKVGAEVIECE
jgi:hypothetical protein